MQVILQLILLQRMAKLRYLTGKDAKDRAFALITSELSGDQFYFRFRDWAIFIRGRGRRKMKFKIETKSLPRCILRGKSFLPRQPLLQ